MRCYVRPDGRCRPPTPIADRSERIVDLYRPIRRAISGGHTLDAFFFFVRICFRHLSDMATFVRVLCDRCAAANGVWGILVERHR
jgi:hypothetical protein